MDYRSRVSNNMAFNQMRRCALNCCLKGTPLTSFSFLPCRRPSEECQVSFYISSSKGSTAHPVLCPAVWDQTSLGEKKGPSVNQERRPNKMSFQASHLQKQEIQILLSRINNMQMVREGAAPVNWERQWEILLCRMKLYHWWDEVLPVKPK